MSTLLCNLVENNILDAETLADSVARFPGLHIFQRLHQLSLNQEPLERQILATIANRYGILGKFDQLQHLQPIPNYSLLKKSFSQYKIILLQSHQQHQAIISLESEFDALELLEFQTSQPLLCIWVTCLELRKLWETCENWENYSQVQSTHHGEIGNFEAILESAITQNCSDIHFEAGIGDEFYARFRVDGKLYDAMRFSTFESVRIISRVKILAGMDIAIKRRPQDGHYTYESMSGRFFDLRICSIPTEKGEKIAIRILDKKPVHRNLHSLGFLKEDIITFETVCRQPSGMILVVGPTGSGKTTTLYAFLNAINSREKNIMTVENPVEYHIDGINQVSIHHEKGLNFSEVLRAFLRQDPDVILVGEIRDNETAQTAVRAALTGHLVLSTLHSKNAFAAIYRLRSLGIELDLLADTLLLVTSQRLVPRNSHQNDSKISKGRLPIYEILRPTDSFRDKVRNNQLQHLSPNLDDSLIRTFQESHQKQYDLIEKIDLQLAI